LKEGYLSIAWPSPPLVHEDVAALDALAIVLGHGEASRLHRAMKRDRLLCTEVQASCYTPVDPGLTTVRLTLQPATAREAVRAALFPDREAPAEGELLELLQEAARLRRPRAPSSSAPPEKRAPVRFAEHPRTGPLLREELPGGGVLLIKEERAVPLVAMRAA